nr:MAG TPA: hypothetical protein [Caudoviricetes sp.]
MKYRNKKTGVVIDLKSNLSGGDWEEVKPTPKTPKKNQVVRK